MQSMFQVMTSCRGIIVDRCIASTTAPGYFCCARIHNPRTRIEGFSTTEFTCTLSHPARAQVVVHFHTPIEAAEIKSREGLSQRLRLVREGQRPSQFLRHRVLNLMPSAAEKAQMIWSRKRDGICPDIHVLSVLLHLSYLGTDVVAVRS